MSSISSKKRTKEFDFTTMIPQVDLFSFIFWRKSKTPKNHFEINYPLALLKSNFTILMKSFGNWSLFTFQKVVSTIFAWHNLKVPLPNFQTNFNWYQPNSTKFRDFAIEGVRKKNTEKTLFYIFQGTLLNGSMKIRFISLKSYHIFSNFLSEVCCGA